MNNAPVSKPEMSFAQIFNMSVGFLGIQFGFALQTGNASRILQTFGANTDRLTLFWLAAPFTGMIIQPIIGHYSDNTWTKLGRRRPYFLTGSLVAAFALLLMPNASLLHAIFPAVVVAAGALMIMDASFNVGMEPFRALVADNLSEKQHDQGFSVQTALIGVGAISGSLLPYLLAEAFGVQKTASNGAVPHNVLYSFFAGAAVLIATVLWSAFTTKEYSPKEYASFHSPEEEQKRIQDEKKGLTAIFSNIRNMPSVMKQLALVQFFTWYALFSMWVFMTPALAVHAFHVKPDDTSSDDYNNAANWVDILFAVYNAVSTLYALLLPRLLRKVSRKKIHVLSLIVGGIALVSLALIRNKYLLILPMLGVGLAWGSALAIPYAILSGSVPPARIGVYMGVFNFTITIPQILNGIVGGLLVKHLFHDQAIYSLVMAGCFLCVAAFSVRWVKSD